MNENFITAIASVLTPDTLNIEVGIANNLEQFTVQSLRDGWQLTPVAMEINENFYNILFVNPTYCDVTQIAYLAMDQIEQCINEVPLSRTCMVRSEKINRLTTTPVEDHEREASGESVEAPFPDDSEAFMEFLERLLGLSDDSDSTMTDE